MRDAVDMITRVQVMVESIANFDFLSFGPRGLMGDHVPLAKHPDIVRKVIVVIAKRALPLEPSFAHVTLAGVD